MSASLNQTYQLHLYMDYMIYRKHADTELHWSANKTAATAAELPPAALTIWNEQRIQIVRATEASDDEEDRRHKKLQELETQAKNKLLTELSESGSICQQEAKG